MLNALRNRIFSSKKKKKSFEEVVGSFHIQEPSPVDYRNKILVTGGEEGWSNYSYLSEILPENETTKDLSKYNHKTIIGEIPQKIKEEINKLYNNTIKSVDLEESKDKNDFTCPTIKLVPAKNDPITLRDFLDNDVSENYNLGAVMLCYSDKDSTRGVRLVLYEDEDGNEIRSYRIINKTYNMDLTWYVEGKECKMKISISDDGSAKILERNGVTDEEICAHNEVMIGGKELEPRFLSEALGLQQTQGKSSEIVSLCQKRSLKAEKTSTEKKQCPYPTTGLMSMNPEDCAREFGAAQECPYPTALIKDFVEKNHEVKAALKDFASEVQSESVNPLTDIIKANVKKADSSVQR